MADNSDNNKNKLSFVFVAVFAIFCAVSVIYMNYSAPKSGTVTDLPHVQVYVKGEVKNPGVYELDVTERVHNAVEKAGGATENGNISNLDLARFLEDGETIYVPPLNKDGSSAAEHEMYSGDKININTASKEELMTLNGIGESLAGRIAAYREKNGDFGDIHDIMNVSGIGEKKFENIKDRICVN